NLVEAAVGRGARRPRPDLWLSTVPVHGSLDRGLHDPGAQGDGGRLEGLFRGAEFDVPESLRNEVIPKLGKLGRLLHVRPEAEVDLRLGHRGVHGLRALFDVATHEAANRARG